MSYFVVSKDVITNVSNLSFISNNGELKVAEFVNTFEDLSEQHHTNLLNTVGYLFNKLFQNQALTAINYENLFYCFDRLFLWNMTVPEVTISLGNFFDELQLLTTLDFNVVANENVVFEGLFYNTINENLSLNTFTNKYGEITQIINYKSLTEMNLLHGFSSQTIYLNVFNNVNTYINTLIKLNQFYSFNYDNLVNALAFFINFSATTTALTSKGIFENISSEVITESIVDDLVPPVSINDETVINPEESIEEEEVLPPTDTIEQDEVNLSDNIEEVIPDEETAQEELITPPSDTIINEETLPTNNLEIVLPENPNFNEEEVTLPSNSIVEENAPNTDEYNEVILPPDSYDEEVVINAPEEPISIEEEVVESTFTNETSTINEEIVEQ